MLKLHLIDVLSICYTANFAAHTVTSRTMERRPNISAVLAISNCPSVAKVGGELFIAANGARLSAVENLSKSTVAHTKWVT